MHCAERHPLLHWGDIGSDDDDDLTNKSLRYYTEIGHKEYKFTVGIPQGSVLGFRLLNIMYNHLLILKLSEEAK